MSKVHDKQIRFVIKAVRLMKLTDDVTLAAIWFRDAKASRLSLDEAIEKFKAWLPCVLATTRPQGTTGAHSEG